MSASQPAEELKQLRNGELDRGDSQGAEPFPSRGTVPSVLATDTLPAEISLQLLGGETSLVEHSESNDTLSTISSCTSRQISPTRRPSRAQIRRRFLGENARGVKADSAPNQPFRQQSIRNICTDSQDFVTKNPCLSPSKASSPFCRRQLLSRKKLDIPSGEESYKMIELLSHLPPIEQDSMPNRPYRRESIRDLCTDNEDFASCIFPEVSTSSTPRRCSDPTGARQRPVPRYRRQQLITIENDVTRGQPNKMIKLTSDSPPLRLRGAEETLACIKRDFYKPNLCKCCNAEIFCIQDADYVLCPTCRVVSPFDRNDQTNEQHIGGNGGVGLGFTFDDLSMIASTAL